MIFSVHGKEDVRTKLITEAQEFWNTNCLYLNKNSRIAFQKAIFAFYDYPYYKESHALAIKSKNILEIEEMRGVLSESFKNITHLVKIIEEDIDLVSTIDVDSVIGREKISPLGKEK